MYARQKEYSEQILSLDLRSIAVDLLFSNWANYMIADAGFEIEDSRRMLDARPSLIPLGARIPRVQGSRGSVAAVPVCMARPYEEPHHSGRAVA